VDNNDDVILMSEAIDHSLCEYFDLTTTGDSATCARVISTNVNRSEY